MPSALGLVRICIRLKFGNRIVEISPQIKMSNFPLYLMAQKTQYTIFAVLSIGICCFSWFLLFIIVTTRISILYYLNPRTIRMRIWTKVALRIILVFLFGQISGKILDLNSTRNCIWPYL